MTDDELHAMYAAPLAPLGDPLPPWQPRLKELAGRIALGVLCSVIVWIVMHLPLFKAAILWLCVIIHFAFGGPHVETRDVARIKARATNTKPVAITRPLTTDERNVK